MKTLVLPLLMLITSCGGGSSDSGPNIELRTVPSSISENLIETETTYWTIDVTVTGDVDKIDEQVYVFIVDKTGVISEEVYIQQTSKTTYRLELNTNKNLASGEYSGNIEIKLCKNSSCSKEYKNSPWLIPLNVNVHSHTNLTNRTIINNYPKDESKPRFIPIDVNSEDISLRWLWKAPEDHSISKIRTSNGFVYALKDNNKETFSDYELKLISIDEETGTTNWESPIDAHFRPEQFIIAGENITIQKTVDLIGLGSGYAISIYDKSSGSLISEKSNLPTESNEAHGLGVAEADENTLYYFDYSNFYNRDLIASTYNFETIWRINGSKKYTGIDVQGNSIFAVADDLTIFNKSTGEVEQQIQPPTSWENGRIIAKDDVVIVYDDSGLNSIDKVNGTTIWSIEESRMTSSPIITHDSIITLPNSYNHKLNATSIETGLLNWSLNMNDYFDPYMGDYPNIIVTNNMVFISIGDETLGINIMNKQVEWRYPFGGKLALSNGSILYIARKDESGIYSFGNILSAINLK